MTSTPTRPVDNVVIATKGLQDRNINILAGTTVENEGKLLILIEYSVYLVYPLTAIALFLFMCDSFIYLLVNLSYLCSYNC